MDEIESALKQLSLSELEAVLDALTLVVEYSRPDPSRGLYLVPPYGELISCGDQKCIVKPREYDIIGDWILVSGKSAYGVMKVGSPTVVSTKEFDRKYTDHRIARKDRLRWWPENNQLWMYPIEMFWEYDSPKPVSVRPGVQTVIEKVQFDSKVEEGKSNNNTLNNDDSLHTHDYSALTVRILHSDEQSEKGFSHRSSISPTEGLLIPMKLNRGIWMKNTSVPLNAAFLSKDYTVLSIVELTPHDETIHIGPDGTAWALEASPQWFEAGRVEVGDVIAMEGLKGGPGSGNFGHSGRPGKRGGSAPSSDGGPLGSPPVSRSDVDKSYNMTGADVGTLYHGGKRKVRQIDPELLQSRDYGYYGEGFYVTTNREYAKWYGSRITEIEIDPSARVLDVTSLKYEDAAPDLVADVKKDYIEQVVRFRGEAHRDKAASSFADMASSPPEWARMVNGFAKRQDYDVVKFGEGEIVIRNPDIVTSYKQLGISNGWNVSDGASSDSQKQEKD